MEKIKVGIIGCGGIAHNGHIPCYMKNTKCEIKYFCDVIKEKADGAVKQYGVGKSVSDYHEILNDPEIKAVSVCTPNFMHSIIAIDALRAGKAVLCEKPAARIYSEALEMQKVAKETKGILNIGVVCRFSDIVNEVKKHIENGDLGEIYHVVADFRSHRSIPGLGGAFTNKSIAGGGTLIDWGVHRIDIIMYCLNEPEIRSVTGKAYCKLGKDMSSYVYNKMWSEETKDLNGVYDVDDSISAFIKTGGASISLNGAWAENIGDNTDFIDFLGTKAGIRLWYCDNMVMYGTMNGMLCQTEPIRDTTSMFQKEIDSFVDCAIEGKRNQADIDHVITTSKILQAIYDSSDNDKEIKF